jgi:hypothetical protein
MTWTYSGDPLDSELDEIRYLVGDIDENDPLVSNEEINYQIVRWKPVYSTTESVEHGVMLIIASMTAEAVAAKFAREVSTSADGVSIGANELQAKYEALALSLRDQYKQYGVGGGPDVGGVLYSDQLDSTIKPTLWSIGMHDNPAAGRQDSGRPPAVTVPEYEH